MCLHGECFLICVCVCHHALNPFFQRKLQCYLKSQFLMLFQKLTHHFAVDFSPLPCFSFFPQEQPSFSKRFLLQTCCCSDCLTKRLTDCPILLLRLTYMVLFGGAVYTCLTSEVGLQFKNPFSGKLAHVQPPRRPQVCLPKQPTDSSSATGIFNVKWP